MSVSTATYEQVALEDGDERWELWCGRLLAKPPVTQEHGIMVGVLLNLLASRLNLRTHLARADVRLQTHSGSYFIPDVCVLPRSLKPVFGAAPRLEVYDAPLPFVAEVWSPSTGDYDVTAKLPEYRLRGDAEIWLVHPHERTAQIWRRQQDGTYSDELVRSGGVALSALPNVTIDLDELFE